MSLSNFMQKLYKQGVEVVLELRPAKPELKYEAIIWTDIFFFRVAKLNTWLRLQLALTKNKMYSGVVEDGDDSITELSNVSCRAQKGEEKKCERGGRNHGM